MCPRNLRLDATRKKTVKENIGNLFPISVLPSFCETCRNHSPRKTERAERIFLLILVVVRDTHLSDPNWDGLGTEKGVLHAWEREEMCADAPRPRERFIKCCEGPKANCNTWGRHTSHELVFGDCFG